MSEINIEKIKHEAKLEVLDEVYEHCKQSLEKTCYFCVKFSETADNPEDGTRLSYYYGKSMGIQEVMFRIKVLHDVLHKKGWML